LAAVKNLGQCIKCTIQQFSVEEEGIISRKLLLFFEYYECKLKESPG